MKKPNSPKMCMACGHEEHVPFAECVCCGATDETDHQKHSLRWIADGMPWRGRQPKQGWNPLTQLTGLARRVSQKKVKGRRPRMFQEPILA